MKKVILSRGRWEDIVTTNVLTGYDLVVPDTEYQNYLRASESFKNKPDAIIQIPDSIEGLGAVRNWCLDHFKDETLIMFDDDIRAMISVMGKSPLTIRDEQMIEEVIQSCSEDSKAAGCVAFGFNQSPDVRKYRPNEPFSLNKWIGCVVGVHGRKYRWTETNKLKVDIDFSLQVMFSERIIWMDNRYGFSQIRNLNSGGCSIFRTKNLVNEEQGYLEEKWQGHIKFKFHKGIESVSINVPRKRSIKL